MSNLLVLEWHPDRIVGVEAAVGREGHRVLRCVSCVWTEETRPDADVTRAGQFLRAQLDQAGATAEEAVVVLPRESVVARKLELPDAPDEELPNLVRFQAATRLATPVDQLALDFLPLPPDPDHAGRNALAVSIDAKRLDKGMKTCAAAGLTPRSVGISSLSVAELVLHSATTITPAQLIVYQQGTRVEISLVDGLQLVFAHSTRLPPGSGASHVQPLLAEINRSLVALSHAHPAAQSADVFLVQDGSDDPDVDKALRQRFGERLRELSPAEMAAALGVPASLAVTAPVLGEFAAQRERKLAAIDLLNPRRPPVPRDVRKQRTIMAAAAAAALIVLGYGYLKWQLGARQTELDRLRAEQQTLEKEVKDGAGTLKVAQAFDEWHRTGIDPLAAMAEWNALSPSTNLVYMQTLSYVPPTKTSGPRLMGIGFSRDREAVLDWFQLMYEENYAVGDPKVGRTGTNPDYPFAFVLEVDLPMQTPAARDSAPPARLTQR
jgi:hypothetical protein